MKVRRVRVALGDDGRVLAVLGAEIETPAGAVETRRDGMTPEAWDRGLWIWPRDFG